MLKLETLYFEPVKYANDDAMPSQEDLQKQMIVSHWPMAMIGPGDDNISLFLSLYK